MVRGRAVPVADLKEELRRVAEIVDRPPTSGDMQEHGQFSNKPYYNNWGTWAKAREAAELSNDITHGPDSIPTRKLVGDLHRIAIKVGRTPRHRDVLEHGNFGVQTYKDRFGSWNEALAEAGYEPITENGYHRKSDLLNDLKRLAMEFGRPPSTNHVRKFGRYAMKPYYKRWDSFEDALEVAGLSTDVFGRQKPAEELAWIYGRDWKQTRRRALERDGFTCQDCGLKNDEHLHERGTSLHVHHIVPISAFDEPSEGNDLSNLVSLCVECHASRHN